MAESLLRAKHYARFLWEIQDDEDIDLVFREYIIH